jgi:hypothetical protein
MIFFKRVLFIVLALVFLAQISLADDTGKLESKRGTGLALTIGGSIVLAASLVLTFADQKEVLKIGYDYITYDKKVKGIYVVGDVVGIITSAIGLAIYIPANRQLKSKVTVSAFPTYKGAGLKIIFTF